MLTVMLMEVISIGLIIPVLSVVLDPEAVNVYLNSHFLGRIIESQLLPLFLLLLPLRLAFPLRRFDALRLLLLPFRLLLRFTLLRRRGLPAPLCSPT